MKLKPGQKLAVVEKDGVVHLVPVLPLKEMRGFAKRGLFQGNPRWGRRRRTIILIV